MDKWFNLFKQSNTLFCPWYILTLSFNWMYCNFADLCSQWRYFQQIISYLTNKGIIPKSFFSGKCKVLSPHRLTHQNVMFVFAVFEIGITEVLLAWTLNPMLLAFEIITRKNHQCDSCHLHFWLEPLRGRISAFWFEKKKKEMPHSEKVIILPIKTWLILQKTNQINSIKCWRLGHNICWGDVSNCDKCNLRTEVGNTERVASYY